MKKVVAVLLVLSVCGTAVFGAFSGVTSGKFVNPVGDSTQLYYASGEGTNVFKTGAPTFLFGSKTVLKYEETNFENVDLCQSFILGNLSYYNGRTVIGTQVDGISLDIKTTFTEPEALVEHFDMDFNFDVTVNRCHGTDDGLLIIPSDLVYEFGDKYTLEILGYSPNGGVYDWYVSEGNRECNHIWAKICEKPSVVPAPGAIVLASIGTAMVGWIRKRRAAK